MGYRGTIETDIRVKPECEEQLKELINQSRFNTKDEIDTTIAYGDINDGKLVFKDAWQKWYYIDKFLYRYRHCFENGCCSVSWDDNTTEEWEIKNGKVYIINDNERVEYKGD